MKKLVVLAAGVWIVSALPARDAVVVDEPLNRLAVSVSDGTYSGTNHIPYCRVGDVLFGVEFNPPRRCVKSTDGITWTRTASTQAFHDYLWALPTGTILGMDSTGGSKLYRSADAGDTFTLVLSAGPAGFSPTAWMYTWSLAEHDGTVVIAEYGFSADGKNEGRRILRSTDDGQTWTVVYDRDVSGEDYKHHHAVAYHASLHRWIAAAGDGIRQRRLLFSDDDGWTWANLTAPHATWVQPTALLDVGDPAALLAGSDERGGVYMLDVGGPTPGKAEQLIKHWPNTVTHCWHLWKSGNLYYASSMLTSGGPFLNGIYVSPDLVNWGMYHQFINDERGVVQYAGVSPNGQMHLTVQQADNTLKHLILSPARVSVRSSAPAVREPRTTNVAPAAVAATNDVTKWLRRSTEWPVFDVATIDGTSCLRLVGCQPAFSDAKSIGTIDIAVVPGTRYIASAEVRGGPCPCEFRTDVVTPTSKVFIRDDQWTHVVSEPFTPTTTVSSIRISCGNYEIDNPVPSPNLTVYLRKVMLAEVPDTLFVDGGATREPEIVSDSLTTPSAWTDVFRVYPRVGSRHLSTLGPLSIRSYVVDAGHYVTVAFDPSDNTFALRRTVDGIDQAPVKTSARSFLAASQLVLAVRSDGEGLALSVGAGQPVSHTAVDLPLQGLDDAPIGVTWGNKGGVAELPMEARESRLLARRLSDAETVLELSKVDLDADGDGHCDANLTAGVTPLDCPHGSGDCDDTNAGVHPGAPEVCNGADDDCDGATDNAAVPAGSGTLTVEKVPSGTQLGWTVVPGATGANVVRGTLSALVGSFGDFSTATDLCLGNGLPGTTVIDAGDPPAGDGYWYLEQPVNCGGSRHVRHRSPDSSREPGRRCPSLAGGLCVGVASSRRGTIEPVALDLARTRATISLPHRLVCRMEENPMNLISNRYALAGLAVALCAVTACSNGSDSAMGGKGRVQIALSASSSVAPAVTDGGSSGAGELKAANVTFASILARNLDGQLIDVTVALPATVDLLTVVTDGAFTLPAGFLPPGTYDQLVIVMTEVALTLPDDTVVTIDPPGGGWTAVIPVTDAFTVVEGQTTEVSITFRLDRLLRRLAGRWEFHPDFECGGHHRH